jgi:nucleoside-diphosphate-sugar epimerase
MKVVVTGVAGFVGSHLAERLLAEGHDVVGVDCFTDYYERARKETNLRAVRESPRFVFSEADLGTAPLEPLLDGAEVVFHQAAQAGVRASWGTLFASYTQHNVLATQRVLETAKAVGVKKVVYASSSSVYGETPDLPMRETSFPRPFSPYGVTKLAAEHLAELYRKNFGLPTASLRYFTVYGPRQRPDMGFHKFIEAILDGREIGVFGDGEQTRDFTFVHDIVESNLAAGFGSGVGVFNVGGGSRVTLREVLAMLGEITAAPPKLRHGPPQAGDVTHTWADTSRAKTELGFAPKVGLREGLTAQVAWHRSLR